jgi:2-iminobutanoate/2-iminopropanoate deaminase
MRRRSIVVPGLEHGSNPIPAACRLGPLLVTGAVRGVDTTGKLPEAADIEVRQAFSNLQLVLAAGGGAPQDVVHVTVFAGIDGLRDLVNTSWAEMFPDPSSRPARHFVRQDLPGAMRVQLEALAYVSGDSE